MNAAASPTPVIIGAGFTGLAISIQLSRAGIDHHLVGRPLAPPPRLGESLEVVGSCEVLRMLPAYRDHLYPKVETVLFLGEHLARFRFNANRGANILYRGLGLGAIPSFFHMDRTAFDDRLFDEALSSPHVRFVDDLVDDGDYCERSDRIERVTLRSGAVLEASYVFDASNQARVVSRLVGVGSENLGAPYQITHGQRSRAGMGEGPATAGAPWSESTMLIRLAEARDGVDGLGWCIPFPTYVSIGMSTGGGVDGAAGLELLLDALLARGVDVRREYPDPGLSRSFAGQYYIQDRASGSNWLLAGPAYCHVWFTTGSGISTSLLAARCAVALVRGDARMGRRYEDTLRSLRGAHCVADQLMAVDPATVTPDEIARQADRLIRANARRISRYWPFAKNDKALLFASVLRLSAALGLYPRRLFRVE